MTPKEKAQELFYKMNDNVLLCQPKYFKSAEIAKKIALISVEMVVHQFNGIYESLKANKIITGKVEESENYKFWNAVKKELELL